MTQDSLPDIGVVSHATIDGLAIRYARGGPSVGTPVLLTAPWPESIYAFRHVVPRLSANHPVFAVDLPGFGLSESRRSVMAPGAMGDFLISLVQHLQLRQVHVVAPDVGALAALFAAAKRPEIFVSIALGGAAATPDLAAGTLKDLIHSPPGAFASIDGVEALGPYLDDAAKLTPARVVEDFKQASAGPRFEAAVQYVRGYLEDLPRLATLLPGISTPVLIIAGMNDPIVPPANGQFLADRLPHSRYMLLDAGHRVWEESAGDYAGQLSAWIGGGYHEVSR